MQIKRPYFILFVMLAGVLFSNALYATEKPDEALSDYHKGISAKTNHERTVAFEKALELYLTYYNDLKSQNKMNGMLCYNIGNCYFNLKQIGQAVYYYKSGLKVLPGNEMITENLTIALNKRQNYIDIEKGGILETLLFFHYKLSTSYRINYLILFSIITSMLFLMLMYRSNTSVKYLSAITSTLVLCLSLSILFEYYKPEHKGVIIQTANIRKDAGQGFAPITPKPLGEGSIVRVISLENEWYKIKIMDNKKGYIQKDFLKLII